MQKVNCYLMTALLLFSHLAISGVDSLKPINAKFETATCDLPCDNLANQLKTQWWLLRHHQQVETRQDGANNSQLWLKSADNQLSYIYLLHDEKRAVEYAAIDLNMLGITTDQTKWQSIANLITKADLASMKKISTTQEYDQYQLEHYQLEHYSGLLNGKQTDVYWIAELQIPFQISYITAKQKVNINLIKDYNDKSPVQATSQQTLMTYLQTDYSDIGDMEHSAISAKWLDKLVGAPGMQPHQH